VLVKLDLLNRLQATDDPLFAGSGAVSGGIFYFLPASVSGFRAILSRGVFFALLIPGLLPFTR
jgi:hypothetical protein